MARMTCSSHALSPCSMDLTQGEFIQPATRLSELVEFRAAERCRDKSAKIGLLHEAIAQQPVQRFA